MARPRPIIVPSTPLQSDVQSISASLNLGPLIEAFRKKREQEAVEAGQELEFARAISEPQPEQFGRTLGILERPSTPTGGVFPSPIAIERPISPLIPTTAEEAQAAKKLSLARLGAGLAPEAFGKAAIGQVFPEAGEIKTAKDVGGFLRYLTGPKAGKRVFPEATKPEEEKSPFALISPKDYTPESLKLFEKSGLHSDLIPREESLQAKIIGKDKVTAENTLRDDFVKQATTFINVRDSFARIQESAKEPTAAGDLSLIFNFMKMLDPASVVRESEFANAQTAQPLLERLGISFNAVGRVWRGEKLSDVARNDFLNRAEQLFERQNAQHVKREKVFKGITQRSGLDYRNVVIDLNDPVFVRQKRIDELERKRIQ